MSLSSTPCTETNETSKTSNEQTEQNMIKPPTKRKSTILLSPTAGRKRKKTTSKSSVSRSSFSSPSSSSERSTPSSDEYDSEESVFDKEYGDNIQDQKTTEVPSTFEKKPKIDSKELSMCRTFLKFVRQPWVNPSTVLPNGQTASEFAWLHIVSSQLSRTKRPRNSSRNSTINNLNTNNNNNNINREKIIDNSLKTPSDNK